MESIWHHVMQQLLASVIFSVVGLGIFALTFWAIVRIVPFSVRKEIEEDQNAALAIIIAALVLGIAYIVGSAIHG